jgi:hypothetical protein
MSISYRLAGAGIRKVTALREHQRPREFVQLDNPNRLCRRQFSTMIGRKQTSKQIQGSTSIKGHHRGKDERTVDRTPSPTMTRTVCFRSFPSPRAAVAATGLPSHSSCMRNWSVYVLVLFRATATASCHCTGPCACTEHRPPSAVRTSLPAAFVFVCIQA